LVDGVDASNFTQFYGDTFILGHTIGGDFLGIISIQVENKNYINAVRSQLEACFGAIQAKDAPNLSSLHISEPMKTSTYVRMIGGQLSKPADSRWEINQILRTALDFPESCANSTEGISPLLATYDAIPAFYQKIKGLKTISYDQVNPHATSLLRDFIDFNIQLGSLKSMHLEIDQFSKSPVANAYAASAAGLSQATRDIRNQVSSVVKEIERIRIDPSGEPPKSGTELYTSPLVLASRFPSRGPLKPQSDSPPPEPESVPAPPPVPADPKEWQWGSWVDYQDDENNIIQIGDGTASVQDIMKGAYQWEAENPGEYVAGFDRKGWLKKGIYKAKKAPGEKLYIRILINDQWEYFQGYARSEYVSTGYRMPKKLRYPDSSTNIVACLKMFTETDETFVMAFSPSERYSQTPDKSYESAYKDFPHKGLWCRKCPPVIY
jgi:hypothetical protein